MATENIQRELDKLIRVRAGQRAALTKQLNALEEEESKGEDIGSLKGKFTAISSRLDSIRAQDEEIVNLMSDLNLSGEDFGIEFLKQDEYVGKVSTLKGKLELRLQSKEDGGSFKSMRTADRTKPKLPRVELRQFSGELLDWIPFWSLFERIHKDPDLDEVDKFYYLVQSTVVKSKARQLVESYPPSAENYKKAISALKNRFGREDLLIEVYIRQLLKLVLSNAAENNIVPIATLFDKIETYLRALESLGLESEAYSAILYPLVESCLSKEILVAWHRSFHVEVGEDDSLKGRLSKLISFLKREVENEERMTLAASGFYTTSEKSIKKERVKLATESLPTASNLLVLKEDEELCIFCKSKLHHSAECSEAAKLPMETRKRIVMSTGVCFICLRLSHRAQKCRVQMSCDQCQRRHCSAMCPGTSTRPTKVKRKPRQSRSENLLTKTNDNIKEEGSSENLVKENSKSERPKPGKLPGQGLKSENLLTKNSSKEVFLQTLVVWLRGNGFDQKIRAIVDTGSQRSYITKSAAELMKYIPLGEEKIIHGLFGGRTSEVKHKRFQIQLGKLDLSYLCHFEALDQPTICSEISAVSTGMWDDELSQLNLEISDRKTGPIDVLLGADVAGKLITGRKIQLKCGLTATETLLGWTLMGKVPDPFEERLSPRVLTSLLSTEKSIEELWKLDVLGICDPFEKKAQREIDLATRQHFIETVNRLKDGRYEVELPWVEGHPPLPSNYGIAKKRLENLLVKLKKENLTQEYDGVLADWLKDGIIELVPEGESDSPAHYLPHRHVVKMSSLTTKVRPVFDAGAAERGSPSLNACLDKGRNTIEAIPNIMNRFRLERIGISSDIAKAFLQISLKKADRDSLRFLWIDKNGKVIIFRHARVVFGVICSPYLLGETIEHHIDVIASANEDRYPSWVVDKLKRSFYVDNSLVSLKTEEEAAIFRKEATNLMADGQFSLRCWEQSFQLGETGSWVTSVLGMSWDREDDSLKLNHSGYQKADCQDLKIKVTKRSILSAAQRIFDPLGISCPISVVPKKLLQQAWMKEKGWDEEVDEKDKEKFISWQKELYHLKDLNIPRLCAREGEWSLHCFCDASQEAYAAVVFLRSGPDKEAYVQMLMAKSRISPSKPMTVPRLELLAATIGARLVKSVQEVPEFSDLPVTYWTDSSTVLAWIRRDEYWGPFVWNRIKEIKALSPVSSWKHVPGTLNPADLPSRGCSPLQLIQSKWWEGPLWLAKGKQVWPKEEFCSNEEEISKEKRKGITVTGLNVEEDWSWCYVSFAKYSRILNMVAWVLRFVFNCRHPVKKDGPLTVDELKAAEIKVLKCCQHECFDGLKDKRLSTLCPFVDGDGLIRIKTKISEREDLIDFRYPIVLPAKHEIVTKLIRWFHNQHSHAGTESLLAIVRERFWVLSGRRAVRSVVTKCVICRRFDGDPFDSPAIPLPEKRVGDTATFQVTGIDLAGPLILKDKQKTWICLFTCAVYRAVHLELLSSLSTAVFLQGFRRFVARRGRPKIVWTDNATNFVGADRALQRIDWRKIEELCAVEKVEWRFTPPSTPWWGGWWERLVGLTKRLLRKTLGRASLTFEELYTVMCECESVLNNRPLTYQSEDPRDLSVLTPAYFLRDIASDHVPDLDQIEEVNLSRRAVRLCKLRKNLRNRFRSEYLGQLILHSKKRSGRSRKVEVGEVVLVQFDNYRKLDWPLAVVQEVIAGRDGFERLVKVRTATGVLTRPIQRLIPLEVPGAIKNTDSIEVEENSTTPELEVEEEEASPVVQTSRSGRPIHKPVRYS